jgi:hypothetical protein
MIAEVRGQIEEVQILFFFTTGKLGFNLCNLASYL